MRVLTSALIFRSAVRISESSCWSRSFLLSFGGGLNLVRAQREEYEELAAEHGHFLDRVFDQGRESFASDLNRIGSLQTLGLVMDRAFNTEKRSMANRTPTCPGFYLWEHAVSVA